MKRCLLLFVVLFFVTGCGGGGGDTVSTGGDDPDLVEPPDIEEVDPETDMTPVPWQCYDTDQERLVEFLNDVLYDDLNTVKVVPLDGVRRPHCGNGSVIRWEESPVLRVAEGTTEEQREYVRQAVRWINSVLPEEYEVDFQEDENAPPLASKSEVPYGEIFVDFTQELFTDHHALGQADVSVLGSEIESARVRILPLTPEKVKKGISCRTSHQFTVTHEILHTMGFCHADHKRYGSGTVSPLSIMVRGVPGHKVCATPDDLNAPSTLDGDALRAMYSLESGNYPDELVIDDEKYCDGVLR